MSNSSQTAAARLSFATILCAVVLGIFGMHGLVSVVGTPEHPGHDVSHVVAAGSTVEAIGDAVEVEETPPAHHHPAILMLCLMILTPGIAVGLWLYVKGRTTCWRLSRTVKDVSTMAFLLKPLSLPLRQLTVLRI